LRGAVCAMKLLQKFIESAAARGDKMSWKKHLANAARHRNMFPMNKSAYRIQVTMWGQVNGPVGIWRAG